MPGLYLHIPYCAQKCLYCGFTSFAGADRFAMERYIRALKRELTIRAQSVSDLCFDTIFVGGGTPSLLPADLFSDLIDHARSTLRVSDGAEFTCECNPESASEALFHVWRACGVNRVSIGVQTFNDALLQRIGRVHTAAQAVKAVQAAQDAGFVRVGIDLICGLPGQTPEDFKKTLQTAIGLAVGHISCYQLEIEPGTPLHEQVQGAAIIPKNGDESADDMALAAQTLALAGYRRYEVSNFALSGQACVHNQNYWRRGAYLGAGLAAHSFLHGCRAWNTADMQTYLNGSFEADSEAVTPEAALEETVMLSLRTCEGLIARLLPEGMLKNAQTLCNRGMLTLHNGRFTATERGFEVLNQVIFYIIGD